MNSSSAAALVTSFFDAFAIHSRRPCSCIERYRPGSLFMSHVSGHSAEQNSLLCVIMTTPPS